MRYYDLIVSTLPSVGYQIVTAPTSSNPNTLSAGSTVQQTSINSRIVKRWTTHPNGQYDAAAQNIMFDLPILPYSTPSGGQTITIEGVSLSDLQQGTQFAGLQFQLSAGMKSGLPLANPKQAGIIAVGTIFQSFANWEGTDMTLDFVVYPAGIENNLVLNWPAGTQLSTALQQTLSLGFPGIKIQMNIGNYVSQHDNSGHYYSLEGLSEAIAQLVPVYITFQNGGIVVFDAKYQPSPVQIDFTDFVGQPTWINVNVMQLKLVMRADLSVGSTIKLPPQLSNKPGQVLTRGSSLPSSMAYQTAFNGTFQVIEMRHIGNSRASDGAQWVTLANCVPVTA